MKIGLIGEDPYDTESIKILLERKHPGVFRFKHLLRNLKGCHLDAKKAGLLLSKEFAYSELDIVIFIRDVDGLHTEDAKIKKVEDWFNLLNKVVSLKGILLMNVYELEALILADINTFNKLYKTDINYSANVIYKEDPKGYLKSKTSKSRKKFTESHCPDIFAQLNFDLLLKKSSYFKNFYEEFKIKANIKNSHP